VQRLFKSDEVEIIGHDERHHPIDQISQLSKVGPVRIKKATKVGAN
jgi:hypothetical protein